MLESNLMPWPEMIAEQAEDDEILNLLSKEKGLMNFNTLDLVIRNKNIKAFLYIMNNYKIDLTNFLFRLVVLRGTVEMLKYLVDKGISIPLEEEDLLTNACINRQHLIMVPYMIELGFKPSKHCLTYVRNKGDKQLTKMILNKN